MKKIVAMVIVMIMAVGMLAGCGGKKTVAQPNAKTASYEEMVNYLKAKGYIDEKAEPVDINVTKGYLTDNTGGQFTQTQVADKAYDYNGLWLFWWDLDAKTDNYATYEGMAANAGTIVLGGGAAILTTEAKNGAFAIAFSDKYADKDKVVDDFSSLPNE
jgi:hypothetical protein